MVVMAPADAAELKFMFRFALETKAPVAIRYPRTTVIESVAGASSAPVELGASVVLRDGSDATILAYGVTCAAAMEAAEMLEADGLDVAVVNARFAKPLDEEAILEAARRGPIVTAEEHSLVGGFGSAVVELLSDRGVEASVTRLGIPDRFMEHGARPRLLAGISLNAAGMADAVRALLEAKRPSRAAASGEAQR